MRLHSSSVIGSGLILSANFETFTSPMAWIKSIIGKPMSKVAAYKKVNLKLILTLPFIIHALLEQFCGKHLLLRNYIGLKALLVRGYGSTGHCVSSTLFVG